MKARFITASMIALFLVATVNHTNAQVNFDYDKTVDFSKYKTYTFKGWEKDSDKLLSDFDKKRVEDSFTSELSERNLKMDANSSDLGITLYLVIQDKTSTTAYTNFNGGMGYGAGFGWGMGMGGGMGSATTTYSEDDYQEGTLVIDFYDQTTKKLVWQGTLQTEVKAKPQKREKAIPKNVAKLMKKYPVKPVS
jgi:hypothetical protein